MPKDFKGVMHEWGKGQLHSGSKNGPVVKSQKQALAIAFSEDKKLKGRRRRKTAPMNEKPSTIGALYSR